MGYPTFTEFTFRRSKIAYKSLRTICELQGRGSTKLRRVGPVYGKHPARPYRLYSQLYRRPPSLDTVNRTFRNIDIAIDQQTQEISQLRNRMAKLEISGGVGPGDQPILSTSKRPLNVTPNVAITTAAALNAERSAQRLKKALLTSRTQPFLNTTATASPLAASFQTPQKGTLEVKTPDVNPPESAFTLPVIPMMSFPSSLPVWTPPPPFDFGKPSTHDISPSRNRGGIKYHQKPIVFKKNASPLSSTSQLSPFDWKPVEPIRPASSLPFALRPAGSS